MLQNLSKVQQSMQNGAFSSTVRTKEERDGPQRDVLSLANAFEVFDPEIRDHVFEFRCHISAQRNVTQRYRE